MNLFSLRFQVATAYGSSFAGPGGVSQGVEGEELVAAWVEGASQDPTPSLLITGHPVATAALAPTPAAARWVPFA